MTEAPSHSGRRSISRMSPRTNSTSAPSRLRGLAPPPNRKPSSAVTLAPRGRQGMAKIGAEEAGPARDENFLA